MSAQALNLSDRKLNYQINEACDALGISRSKLYSEVKAGRLRMGRFLGRSVIARNELERFWREHFSDAA